MKNILLTLCLCLSPISLLADAGNRWEYQAGIFFYNHEYYRPLSSNFKSQSDALNECNAKVEEAKQKLISNGMKVISTECGNKKDGNVLQDTFEGGFLAGSILFEGDFKEACKVLDLNSSYFCDRAR